MSKIFLKAKNEARRKAILPNSFGPRKRASNIEIMNDIKLLKILKIKLAEKRSAIPVLFPLKKRIILV